MTFMEQYRARLVEAEAINEWVERWHSGPDDERSLGRYLGMTDEEYFDWVRDPATLLTLRASDPRSESPR